MTGPNPLLDLCTAIIGNNRLAALSALEKGFDVNQFVDWNSLTETVSEEPASLEPVLNDIAGPRIAQESEVYKALPLNLAVIKGHLDIVTDLLNAGANPSKKDGRNRCLFIIFLSQVFIISYNNYFPKKRNSLICAIYGSLDTLIITAENFKSVTQSSEAHRKIIEFLFQVRSSL